MQCSTRTYWQERYRKELCPAGSIWFRVVVDISTVNWFSLFLPLTLTNIYSDSPRGRTKSVLCLTERRLTCFPCSQYP